MHTILVQDDNTLRTSVRKRILHGTSNVDYMHILANPYYGDIDIRNLTAVLTYILPVSKERCSETLIPSADLYKGKIEYIVRLDENWTSEVGDIQLSITFIDGDTMVRKTNYGIISILPTETIDVTPNKPAETLVVDDIYLDKATNEIYLTSNGMTVGKSISINDLTDAVIESSANEGLVTMITE